MIAELETKADTFTGEQAARRTMKKDAIAIQKKGKWILTEIAARHQETDPG
jgi:hypothetical protein